MSSFVTVHFRDDEYGTTLPQECRRSGLNDGTMRKCRAEDIDEPSSLSSSADMSSDVLLLVRDEANKDRSTTTTKNNSAHVLLYMHCCDAEHSCICFLVL